MRRQIEDGEISFNHGEAILRRLSEALGEIPEGYDPLVDQWERELEQGLIPDLDA